MCIYINYNVSSRYSLLSTLTGNQCFTFLPYLQAAEPTESKVVAPHFRLQKWTVTKNATSFRPPNRFFKLLTNQDL